MVVFLNEKRVGELLSYEQLIPCMEKALAALSAGEVVMPTRNMITVEENKRFLGVMPAVTKDGMGAKLVAFYPKNAGTKHHTHTACIVLFDTETAEPLAFMDGGLITEMRTAAVSAAVTKYAAMHDSRVLAIIGSGVQAKAHLAAIRTVIDVREVRVWSNTAQNARDFAAKHGAIAMSAEDAVRGADVVVVATSSRTPVLKGEWLKKGAHVNSVGAAIATWREMDDAVMANFVIADSREAVAKESGDVILSKALVAAEAGEIFSGKLELDRNLTTVFKSVGLAVEDIATARLVYDLARAAK